MISREQESSGILRNPEESGVNTGIPVPQEFLRKNPVKSEKNRNYCDPLQNHVPVKKSSGKCRKNKNPQESCQERFFGSTKLIPENRNYQPRPLTSSSRIRWPLSRGRSGRGTETPRMWTVHGGLQGSWKKHVRNLFWGNETENTARHVSSRQL